MENTTAKMELVQRLLVSLYVKLIARSDVKRSYVVECDGKN